MRIITAAEVREWLGSHGLGDPERTDFYGPCAVSWSFRIPPDSGKKTGLAKALLTYFQTDSESLLWITEYGIWPGSEDRGLFDGFRLSLGESRPVQDKPGHVFARDDVAQVASLLGMVLYFVWGGLLVSAQGDVMVEVSHDEMIDITVKNNPNLAQAIRETIEPIVR